MLDRLLRTEELTLSKAMIDEAEVNAVWGYHTSGRGAQQIDEAVGGERGEEAVVGECGEAVGGECGEAQLWRRRRRRRRALRVRGTVPHVWTRAVCRRRLSALFSTQCNVFHV